MLQLSLTMQKMYNIPWDNCFHNKLIKVRRFLKTELSSPGVVQEEHHHHDDHAERETRLWQTPDPYTNTRYHGNSCNECDAPDDDDLVCSADFDVFIKIV